MSEKISPLALRGSYIYLALATLIVGANIITVLVELLGMYGETRWPRVAFAVAMIAGMVYLWWGQQVVRGTMAGLCIVGGIVSLVSGSRLMLALWQTLTPNQWNTLIELVGPTIPVVCLWSLFNIAAGLIIYRLPSVQAFFAHQRGEYWHE